MKAIITIPTVGRPTLKHAINSVLRQRDQRFSLLVFDDRYLKLGLPRLCNHIALTLVRLYRPEDLWIFLGDDDVLLPNRVEHDLALIGQADCIVSKFDTPQGIGYTAESNKELFDHLAWRNPKSFLITNTLSVRVYMLELLFERFGCICDFLRFPFMMDWTFLLFLYSLKPETVWSRIVTSFVFPEAGFSKRFSAMEAGIILNLLRLGYINLVLAIGQGKADKEALWRFPLF